MKIAIITDVLGEENNGTTITIKRLIEGLKKNGNEVRVVSPLATNEPGYYTLDKRSFWIFNKYVAKNGVELGKPDEGLIRKAIEGVDVVHIVLPFKVGRCAIKIVKQMGIPFTTAFHCQAENVTAHLFMKNLKLANDIVYKRFYRVFYKDAPIIHCPSAFIANEIKKRGYDNKLYVISNGVAEIYGKKEVEKPKELKDKFCILFTGRYSKEKRHDLLIKAIYQSKYKDKIQLICAGCGPLEAKLKKLSKDLPNQPIFNFFSKGSLVDVINYCDLYVHPSDIEIEAISCLEAIACGLVPIISDSKKSATNQFALTDYNLFKAGNSGDLANKIDFLIENKKIKEELEKKYANYAKQFNLNSCVLKMEEMFKDAIKEKGNNEKTKIKRK